MAGKTIGELIAGEMPTSPPVPYPFGGDPSGRDMSAFPMPPADPFNPYPLSPSDWAKRADGSQKGNGFLGALIRPDGAGVSSEISIGVNIGGKEVEIPTIVPTLSTQELHFLLTQDYKQHVQIPDSIVTKAVNYAKQRLASGKPLFAQAGEEQQSLHPQFRRAGIAPAGMFK